MAREKRHITPASGQGVGKTVADVQAGRMAPFAEALSGVDGSLHQVGVSGFDLHLGGAEQIAQRLHTRAAAPG